MTTFALGLRLFASRFALPLAPFASVTNFFAGAYFSSSFHWRKQLLKEAAPSEYLNRIRVLPHQFEEFVRWMDEKMEGGEGAQADLLFFRKADILKEQVR